MYCESGASGAGGGVSAIKIDPDGDGGEAGAADICRRALSRRARAASIRPSGSWRVKTGAGIASRVNMHAASAAVRDAIGGGGGRGVKCRASSVMITRVSGTVVVRR